MQNRSLFCDLADCYLLLFCNFYCCPGIQSCVHALRIFLGACVICPFPLSLLLFLFSSCSYYPVCSLKFPPFYSCLKVIFLRPLLLHLQMHILIFFCMFFYPTHKICIHWLHFLIIPFINTIKSVEFNPPSCLKPT